MYGSQSARNNVENTYIEDNMRAEECAIHEVICFTVQRVVAVKLPRGNNCRRFRSWLPTRIP